MKITQDYDKNGMTHYTVLSNGSKYKVDCLDGVYMCECALLYKRNIYKHCKHINAIRKWIIEND